MLGLIVTFRLLDLVLCAVYNSKVYADGILISFHQLERYGGNTASSCYSPRRLHDTSEVEGGSPTLPLGDYGHTLCSEPKHLVRGMVIGAVSVVPYYLCSSLTRIQALGYDAWLL